jgi:SAM-dependent methyltransferase
MAGMPESFGREMASIPYWEREAARYHEHVDSERAAYHAGRLATATGLLERAALPARARVLDFGCGDGVYARELAGRGFSVIGLDPAAPMIELARSQDPDGVYEVGGAADLASVGACDAVVAPSASLRRTSRTASPWGQCSRSPNSAAPATTCAPTR